MAAVRNGWNLPLNPWLDRVFDEVDRTVRETTDRGVAFVRGALPMSLWQDDEAYHVEVELPGAKLDEVEATVHDGRLHLRYERKPEEGRTYLHNSRRYGKVEQVLTLPEPVDTSRIDARFADGVLHLTLPRSAEARPFRINIKASAPHQG
jgi:HSP20 family protein